MFLSADRDFFSKKERSDLFPAQTKFEGQTETESVSV
jgi:hypothetical protein